MINQNDATVGELLGDGVVLSFSSPSVIRSFFVCLRLNQKPSSFRVPDFGYSSSKIESIYPLGLFNYEKIMGDAIFWGGG